MPPITISCCGEEAMNNSALHAVIQEYGKELKVPAMVRLYPEIARQARDGEWRYEEFLKQLLEAEVGERRDHCAERRIRQARFPDRKTLDQIDWQALRGVSKPKVLELASCEYVEQGHDVVLAGLIGTGKTHLAADVHKYFHARGKLDPNGSCEIAILTIVGIKTIR